MVVTNRLVLTVEKRFVYLNILSIRNGRIKITYYTGEILVFNTMEMFRNTNPTFKFWIYDNIEFWSKILDAIVPKENITTLMEDHDNHNF